MSHIEGTILLTPGELVRLELLHHDDPEGLHPVELAWRQLARKLFQQVKHLQELAQKHQCPSYCKACQETSLIAIPERFKFELSPSPP